MTSICLNMIVKNEAAIIRATLENICQHFDLKYWVISDTGSTDNTIAEIEAFFKEKNITGQIHRAKWKNFAYNRNLALKACKDKADYVLFFDADDRIEGDLKLPDLHHDAYCLQMTDEKGQSRYLRKLLVKNHQQFHWVGVLHEMIVPMNDCAVLSEVIVKGDYVVCCGHFGARNQNAQRALDDAKLLEVAFPKEKNIELKKRYAFYCAQAYAEVALQDQQYSTVAIDWYKTRISFDHCSPYDDEKYSAYEMLGLFFERNDNVPEALRAWEQGAYLDPQRAECWYHLARIHHWNKNYQLAYGFAQQAHSTPLPQGHRVVFNRVIYDYWCAYEVMVLQWRLNAIEDSYQTFKQCLAVLPEHLMENIRVMFPAYYPWIAKDQFCNVQKLIEQLQQKNLQDLVDPLHQHILSA